MVRGDQENTAHPKTVLVWKVYLAEFSQAFFQKFQIHTFQPNSAWKTTKGENVAQDTPHLHNENG